MEDEKKTVDTIKEKYKRIVCRFIQGLLFDTENDFNKLEMMDIDFDAMKIIFDNYYKENGLCGKQDWHVSSDGDNGLTIGKAILAPASDTDNWQDSERMKIGAVKNVLL